MDENKTLDKIIAALKIAEKEFLEKKAANNETIILSDKDGKIIEVPAKDLLKVNRDKVRTCVRNEFNN